MQSLPRSTSRRPDAVVTGRQSPAVLATPLQLQGHPTQPSEASVEQTDQKLRFVHKDQNINACGGYVEMRKLGPRIVALERRILDTRRLWGEVTNLT
jgi:hypothetical protein